MKHLTTLLLTLLVLGGCTTSSFKACVVPPYENFGYVEVLQILNNKEETIIYGLSQGCDEDNFIKLSDNQNYKCKEDIKPQDSNRAILLSREIRDIYTFNEDFKGDNSYQCGSGSIAELCRNQLKYPRKINVLENSGFKGPFILERAKVRSSTSILITSDDERYSIEKQLDLIPSEDYLVTKNRAWSCEYIDNNGKEFNFSDMI